MLWLYLRILMILVVSSYAMVATDARERRLRREVPEQDFAKFTLE